ncbi:hypothetical protein OIE68_15470 [Nocardia vinacea]|uniref:hypothetical protein n=1 Tax=Nocardia vinacea TaxID=96468 RepID=UPI002E0EE050|nr:hypothetical protein OIE68_15470 [Nocardia vinacea]
MEPWAVDSPSDGLFRFANNTGEQAVMITLTPIGNVELKPVSSAEIHENAVTTSRGPGEHFDLKIKRKISVGKAGLRITWTTPGRGHNSWDYSLPE